MVFHEESHQLEIVSLLYPLFRYDKTLLDIMVSSILLHDEKYYYINLVKVL
jgi:hypothetical protein